MNGVVFRGSLVVFFLAVSGGIVGSTSVHTPPFSGMGFIAVTLHLYGVLVMVFSARFYR